MISGTQETRRFYNEVGWTEDDGASVDRQLFGVKEDGPIRIELHHVHLERVRAALAGSGTPVNLLECGCGGNPEKKLLSLCSKYTGVDFSNTGIQMARSSFANVKVPHAFHVADVCSLPFPDGAFDAAYCAHMVYHIVDVDAQRAAIQELVRVVKPGGVVVLITANPRPLAFPVRLLRRLAADTPVIGKILNRLRPKPPLPYKPMTIGWMRTLLAPSGSVEILCADIPPTHFYQKVTEYKGAGKLLWKCIRWLDVNYPKLSGYLGNYVIVSLRKAAVANH